MMPMLEHDGGSGSGGGGCDNCGGYGGGGGGGGDLVTGLFPPGVFHQGCW